MRTKNLLFAGMIAAKLAFAGPQPPPRKTCNFDGFPANSKMAEVLIGKSAIAYYGCAPNGKCLSMNLEAGSPVVVFQMDGDWICGYFSNRHGAAPGWVLASEVRLITFDQNPPLRAWIGAWAGGEDRVRIQTSNAPGKLRIQGSATWRGSGNVVHTGDFSGEATPDGNHVHFTEGDAESCTIDMTLFGKYILANDNDRCGGMNVRFWGVWERRFK